MPRLLIKKVDCRHFEGICNRKREGEREREGEGGSRGAEREEA